MKNEDFLVKTLGHTNVKSPLLQTSRSNNPQYKFITDSDRILYDNTLENFKNCKETDANLSRSKKPGPANGSILNLPKPKLELSPAAVYARD
jgi:hypothetical protein